MNLAHLRTFLEITEARSLSQAAARLHLTQPAVSKQLQALEEDLGVNLVLRRGRELALTAEGEKLKQYAEQILRLLEEARSEILAQSRVVQGNLRLEASTIPGQYILPQCIAAFLRRYPQVQISLGIGDTAQVIDKLLADQIHLGAVGARIRHPAIGMTKLAPDRLVVIAPADHPWGKRAIAPHVMASLPDPPRPGLADFRAGVARRNLAADTEARPGEARDLPGVHLEGWIRVDDLVAQPLVWREKGSATRAVVEERLAQAGIPPEKLKVIHEMGSTEAVVQAVEAGLGVSVVSEWAVSHRAHRRRLLVFALEGVSLERDLYLIYRRHHQRSRPEEAFLAFIRQHRQLVKLPLPL